MPQLHDEEDDSPPRNELAIALSRLPAPQTPEERKVVERVAKALGMKMRAQAVPKTRSNSRFVAGLQEKIAPLLQVTHGSVDSEDFAEKSMEEEEEDQEVESPVIEEPYLKPSVQNAVRVIQTQSTGAPAHVWSTPAPPHSVHTDTKPIVETESAFVRFEDRERLVSSVHTQTDPDPPQVRYFSPAPPSAPPLYYTSPTAPVYTPSHSLYYPPAAMPPPFIPAGPLESALEHLSSAAEQIYRISPPRNAPLTTATPIRPSPPRYPTPMSLPTHSLPRPSPPSRSMPMSRPVQKHTPYMPDSLEMDAASHILSLGDTWKWSDIVVEFMNKQGDSFGQMTWLRSVRRLMDEIKIEMKVHIKNDDVLRGISSTVLHRAMERVSEHACITPLKRSIDQVLDRTSRKRDILLNKKLRSLRGNTQNFFGVKPEHQSESSFSTVVSELCTLDSAVLPCDKIHVISRAVKAIFYHVSDDVGAYDLVPILSYALANADISEPERTADFVLNLCDPQTLAGEEGYHMMCFQSCLNVIASM